MTRLAALLLAAAGVLGGCGPLPAQGVLRHLDLDRPQARYRLPGRLAEISGLAFTSDGRLFAHDDERGIVYRIDPRTGDVDRGFQVGETLLRDDFEALAIAGDRFFLASSRGILYEFREAPERGTSPVLVTDAGLGRHCEVEGLAYHEASESLLVACKTTLPEAAEVGIHVLPLTPGAQPPPPLRIPWSAFAPWGHEGAVNPSGLDVDPLSGTLVVAAARQEFLFRVDLDGRLLDVRRLDRRRHPQTEGVAFSPDGRLWLADEAAGGDAHVTLFGPRPPGRP